MSSRSTTSRGAVFTFSRWLAVLSSICPVALPFLWASHPSCLALLAVRAEQVGRRHEQLNSFTPLRNYFSGTAAGRSPQQVEIQQLICLSFIVITFRGDASSLVGQMCSNFDSPLSSNQHLGLFTNSQKTSLLRLLAGSYMLMECPAFVLSFDLLDIRGGWFMVA